MGEGLLGFAAGVFEVAVYHNPEADPASESQWALLVRAVTKEKWLGVVPRVKERELDAGAVATLEEVFREAGIRLRRAPDGGDEGAAWVGGP